MQTTNGEALQNAEAFEQVEANASWSEISTMLSMLAQIVNNVPDKEWTPSLRATVESLDGDAPGCARMKGYLVEHANDALDLLVQDLAVDWTLAFRGMNPAYGPRPPYAGAWLADDGTGVELMLAINSCYVEEGLGSSGSHLNRFDYLGVELEFMAHLTGKLGALEEGGEEAVALAQRALDFERRYILSWLSRYQEHVEERCKTEFWKGFLELVAAVLADIEAGLKEFAER